MGGLLAGDAHSAIDKVVQLWDNVCYAERYLCNHIKIYATLSKYSKIIYRGIYPHVYPVHQRRSTRGITWLWKWF